MSRIFGPMRQLGYVVRDIDAAIEHWTGTLGIGPFFLIRKMAMSDVTYRGAPSPIALSIALANSGDVQIELIEQLNDAPSVYRDHLEAHGEGLHHTSSWSLDFDADMARIRAAGATPVQEARIGANRLAYFETQGAYPSTMMEIYDISGRPEALFARIREAARNWDGDAPVRAVD